MISHTVIFSLTTLTSLADLDYFNEYQSNEIPVNLDRYQDPSVSIGDTLMPKLNDSQRTNRRNEYVPFNSLTLGEGKSSSSKFSSKFKSKIKDKIKNRNKVEWWTKKKKKDKKKSESKVKVVTSTVRSEPLTTKKLTTWFPTRKTTTSSYFSRPLDYQRPVRPISLTTSEVSPTALGRNIAAGIIS